MTGTKKIILVVSSSLIIFGLWLWCTLAISFSNLPGETLPIVVAGIFALGVPLALIFLPNRKRTAYGVSILCAGIIVAWSQIKPSHDRDWTLSVAKLPRVTIEGNQVKIQNIRNFDYRTEKDFIPRYFDKTYDLSKLETVDYALSYWDGNEAVAHTILSFGFGDEGYLAVSVETRLEKGEPQAALRGLFKQYELIYVLGDERDLLRLRTNFRKEDVFLYPTTLEKEEALKVFNVIIVRINSIAEQPQFYNTVSQNCLTSLAADLNKAIELKSMFDYRRILNGYSDEMIFENGRINSKLGFKQTKRLHYINQYLQDDDNADDYSKKIRPHNKKKSD